MKRIIIIVIALCYTYISYGQIRCTTDYPDLEIKYKRTTVSGNNVYVDFVMTYYGKDEMEITVIDGHQTLFYDDEGNIYKGQGSGNSPYSKIIADVGNTDSSTAVLPSGIPVKLRLTVKEVDEFSTSFTKAKISFISSSKWYEMQIGNVPIPRD